MTLPPSCTIVHKALWKARSMASRQSSPGIAGCRTSTATVVPCRNSTFRRSTREDYKVSEILKYTHWTDRNGSNWKIPTIKGRLKPGKIPCHRALRSFVIERDNGKCRICGSVNDLVADHIISRRNGGSHHPDNLQCLCDSCNARKSGLIDSKFLKKQQ